MNILLVILLWIPFGAVAQDFSVVRTNDKNISLNAYYWAAGDSATKANLILSYSIPISELRMEQSKAGLLTKFAKSLFPDIFGVSHSELSESKGYALAQTAKVKFRLARRGKVYAVCEAPKNFYGYGFSASGSASDRSNAYVSITSNPLPVNKVGYSGQKKPFRICKDRKGGISNPVVNEGDTISLLQGNLILLTDKFRTVSHYEYNKGESRN